MTPPRKPKAVPKSVRVWGEMGISMPVSNDDPSAWIKVTVGHERIAPNDSVATLKKTEALIAEFNEEALDKRVKEIRRLIQQASK